MDSVLDQVDDKVAQMYQTLELKLKHVSKSFAAKFDWYENSFKESKTEMEAMFLKASVGGDNESIKESVLAEQMEDLNRDIELNAQLQGAKL